MLTYYRRRTDKAHKIILYFFQRLDSKMDSEMMYIMKIKIVKELQLDTITAKIPSWHVCSNNTEN